MSMGAPCKSASAGRSSIGGIIRSLAGRAAVVAVGSAGIRRLCKGRMRGAGRDAGGKILREILRSRGVDWGLRIVIAAST